MLSPLTQLLMLATGMPYTSCFLLLVVGFCVWFCCFAWFWLWFSFFGLQGLVTALWTMYRSSTSSPFGASQSVDGRVYAIISQFTVSVQRAVERVERPGESQ